MQLDNCALNELRNEIGLISIDFLQLHNLHTLYMIYGAPVWTLTNTQQFETIKAKKRIVITLPIMQIMWIREWKRIANYFIHELL